MKKQETPDAWTVISDKLSTLDETGKNAFWDNWFPKIHEVIEEQTSK